MIMPQYPDNATQTIALKIPLALLAIGFFSIPFSPTLDSLVVITGLWSLFYKPLRIQLKLFTKSPAFLWGSTFFAWWLLRMLHDDPAVTNHLKLHYLLHYLNFFLPMVLLPPIFRNEKSRLIIYASLLFAALLISLMLWNATHLFINSSFLTHQKFLASETEPMAVFYVFAVYLLTMITWEYKKHKLILYTGIILFFWFSYIIMAVQSERVAIVLYFIACTYFLFTHFSLRYSFFMSAFLIMIASLFITFSHSTIHEKSIKAYTNTILYFNQTTHSKAEQTSVGLRFGFYQNGIRLLKQKPLMGYGAGTFSGGTIQIRDTTLKTHLTTPENNYLAIALQLGLIGLAFFLLYLFYLWRYCLLMPDFEQKLGIGILLIISITAFDDPAFAVNISALTFGGLMGVLFGARCIKKLAI